MNSYTALCQYNYALKALHLICHVQLKVANLFCVPDLWNEVPVLGDELTGSYKRKSSSLSKDQF